jgi:hypothetical protein
MNVSPRSNIHESHAQVLMMRHGDLLKFSRSLGVELLPTRFPKAAAILIRRVGGFRSLVVPNLGTQRRYQVRPCNVQPPL